MGEISGTHRGDIGEIQGPFRVRAKLRVRVRVRVRVTVRVRVRVRVMVTVGVRVMVTVGVRVRARARVRVRVRVRGRVPGVRRAVRTARACPRPPACRMRTCERVRAQTLSLGAAPEGWQVASTGGEARWPMAVAGVAAWCCRCRGRPPCQPA